MDGRNPDVGTPIGEPTDPEKSDSVGQIPPEERSALDADATFHEEPLNPAFTKELQKAREELRDIKKPNNTVPPHHNRGAFGLTTSEDETTAEKPRSNLQKVGDAISNAAWETKLVSTMIFELGGFHPARINGQWHWVIEPWARVQMDPRQGDMGDNDYYLEKFNKLKRNGTKVIYMEGIGGETPYIRPLATGIQLLDHRRIMTAQSVGLPIVVEPLNYETFD